MAVDHDLHVGRAQVVLSERVRGVAIHDLPFLDQLLVAPPHAGVDENRAGTWVLDDEAVHGDVVEAVEIRQVEADDLQAQGRKGESAKTMKRTAT